VFLFTQSQATCENNFEENRNNKLCQLKNIENKWTNYIKGKANFGGFFQSLEAMNEKTGITGRSCFLSVLQNGNLLFVQKQHFNWNICCTKG